jgi:hypothetical protein
VWCSKGNGEVQTVEELKKELVTWKKKQVEIRSEKDKVMKTVMTGSTAVWKKYIKLLDEEQAAIRQCKDIALKIVDEIMKNA